MTVYNWRTIAVQTVIVATAALGMTLIMIAGGIDLSVGSVVALVCVGHGAAGPRDAPAAGPGGPLCRRSRWPGRWRVASLLGGLCGMVNGALITGLRVVPFIITLGSLKVYRGLAKWLSNSTSVYIPAGVEVVVVRQDHGRPSPSRRGWSSRRASGCCWA